MTLILAISEPYLSHAREIFREYQLALGIDLCFQNFEQELSLLPGKYAPPNGRLYLAYVQSELAGSIALRPLDEDRCEMKRLYVRSKFRGHNLGRVLAEKVITEAKQIGYKQILLDTFDTMTAAQNLYHSLNFYEIPAYCLNPMDGVRYMCLDL